LLRQAVVLVAAFTCHVLTCKNTVATVATRAAGRTPMRGLAPPSAELVRACLAPRAWVWGVRSDFALRCVALPCGVFVRLHLALLPGGGPFLPSLYVKV
jgi:hypothetical protein